MKSKQTHFHAGEIAVQKRIGATHIAEQIASGFISGSMPGQYRMFFSQLPLMIFGAVDQSGYPWPVPVFGEPGFIRSPNDTTLSIAAKPRVQTALNLDLSLGQKIGGLGIELATRRRIRINGIINNSDDQSFGLKIDQSYGNCPQYIQARDLHWINEQRSDEQLTGIDDSPGLNPKFKDLLEQADTFFIASRSSVFNSDPRSGIDASHRGGKPGFVKVKDNTIYFPDYRGNRFYNTLGNIESDGRVGLLFTDFASGNSVLVAGRAKIIWNQADVGPFKGSERTVAVVVERSLFIPQLFELTSTTTVLSPALRNTGTWSDS